MSWATADAFLFDIDGTLLHAHGGVHQRALRAALRTRYGRSFSTAGVPIHGSTDIAILRAVVRNAGLEEQDWESGLSQLLDHINADVDRNRALIRAEVCPGVPELVSHLHARGKLLGLGTGNLELVGWAKLDAAGLRHYFTFGAFCGPHELRADIIRSGVEQARARLGSQARVCVIGDTPHDITAARVNNVSVVAVATGIFSYERLAEHAPDVCVRDCRELLTSL
ncbi:MAG: HAD family hydrolase [Acidobacteriales bacterium]|nr:HAD family hydrolase [Terriglobales bacterium]